MWPRLLPARESEPILPLAAVTHQRLSIIDLAARGDQPLSKYGLMLVDNGEFYKESRAELASRGACFVISSDPEVARDAAPLGTGGAAPVPRHVRVHPSRREDRRAVPSA
jgi:hypothetical protein